MAYRWEFEKGSQSLAVGVNGALVIDDMDMTIRAAMDSVGLAFSLDEYVAPHIASGALVRVLEDWCPPFAGFFLYYPTARSVIGVPGCLTVSRTASGTSSRRATDTDDAGQQGAHRCN